MAAPLPAVRVVTPLAGSALVCLKVSPCICTLSFVSPFVSLCPFFFLCIICNLSGICLRLPASGSLYRARPCSVLCSARPRLNRFSLGLW